MATHSSTLAWKIPWMEEPGRLQSVGSLSWTRLNDFTLTFHFHALEKEMATHSSVLAERTPGTGEPDGLPSKGSRRVRHDWSDLAAAAAAAWNKWSFPGGTSGKEPSCQCRRCKRHGFNPWIKKIPWRRKWRSDPVFLPGKFHRQRSLVGYNLWDYEELDTTEQLTTWSKYCWKTEIGPPLWNKG